MKSLSHQYVKWSLIIFLSLCGGIVIGTLCTMNWTKMSIWCRIILSTEIGLVSIILGVGMVNYFEETIKFQWFYFRVLCNFMIAVIGWILSFGINSYTIKWRIDEKKYEATLPNIETMINNWKEK